MSKNKEITIDQILIFEKFKGDGDDLEKFGTKQERDLLDYKHYKLLDSLIQDSILINKGLTSESFKKEFAEKLKRHCKDENVRTKILSFEQFD